MYVANDGHPNQLWINQRDGTFKDVGLLSGAAFSEHGKAKAGMGVDAGDFDNDGDEDVFVTNLTGEGHDLYVNDGSGTFETRSAVSGLAYTTLPYTGFGTAWLDIDNDGWLDLMTVNGTVQRIDALVRANDPNPLRQRKQIFRNTGHGRFEDVTGLAGPVFDGLMWVAARPLVTSTTMGIPTSSLATIMGRPGAAERDRQPQSLAWAQARYGKEERP